MPGGRRAPREPTGSGRQFSLCLLIQLPLEHASLDSFPGVEVGHWIFCTLVFLAKEKGAWLRADVGEALALPAEVQVHWGWLQPAVPGPPSMAFE